MSITMCKTALGKLLCNTGSSVWYSDDLEGWDRVGAGRGRFKREGTYVYLRLIHAVIWQKPTQHCKAIILQLKKNRKAQKEGLQES